MTFRAKLTDWNVLTLTEPWASLVVDGQKTFETRYWPTSYRGRLFIQAAKGFPAEARATCYNEPFKSALTRRQDLDDYRRSMLFYDPVEFLWKGCGKIIGVVELVDTARTEKVREALEAVGNPRSLEELRFGDYSTGRWAFRFNRPRRFREPVPVRGSLGIWGITESAVIELLKNQLSLGVAA